MTDDEWLRYFADLYRDVTKDKENKALKTVRQNLTRALRSIIDANIDNTNDNENEICPIVHNTSLILSQQPTSGSDISRRHIGLTDIINNTIEQIADTDMDEDDISNTEKAIVPNNMIILPNYGTNDVNSENSSSNIEDTENTQINQARAQKAVPLGKKRKRACQERNSSFFCSCAKDLDRRGPRSEKGRPTLVDIDRAFLTIEEIDIYGDLLNKEYGPDNYVMRSDLFFGFLRDIRDKDVQESERSQIDMVNILQVTTPMTIDFTAETVERILMINSSYPKYETFQEMRQVRNNMIYANITVYRII